MAVTGLTRRADGHGGPWRRVARAVPQALLVALSTLVLVQGIGIAVAGGPPVVDKKVVFIRQGDKVCMSVGFRELFNRKLIRRLKSGFATTVVMRVYVYQMGSSRPIFVTGRTLRAVYDLWDEVFRLQFEDTRGKKLLRMRDEMAVVDALSSFWRFPLMRHDELKQGRSYFVAALAEVNPMSPKVLASVRRWLRKPRRRQMGGDSLFGSFVSIFVNDKIRSAERSIKIRSQPFYRAQ